MALDIYQRIWNADQEGNGLKPVLDTAEVSNLNGFVKVNSKLDVSTPELRVLPEVLIPDHKKQTYSSTDKTKMVELLNALDLAKSDTGDYVILRQIREKLVKRKQDGTMEIIANHRSDWVGWLELKTEEVNEIAMMNTGRVIRDVDANKIDYLLLSPALFAKVDKAGLFRMGAYPGANPKWPVYPTLTKKVHAASDHHVVWVELNI